MAARAQMSAMQSTAQHVVVLQTRPDCNVRWLFQGTNVTVGGGRPCSQRTQRGLRRCSLMSGAVVSLDWDQLHWDQSSFACQLWFLLQQAHAPVRNDDSHTALVIMKIVHSEHIQKSQCHQQHSSTAGHSAVDHSSVQSQTPQGNRRNPLIIMQSLVLACCCLENA